MLACLTYVLPIWLASHVQCGIKSSLAYPLIANGSLRVALIWYKVLWIGPPCHAVD